MFNFYLLEKSFDKKTTIFCLQEHEIVLCMNIQNELSNIIQLSNICSVLAAFEGWNYKSSFCMVKVCLEIACLLWTTIEGLIWIYVAYFKILNSLLC